MEEQTFREADIGKEDESARKNIRSRKQTEKVKTIEDKNEHVLDSER